MFSKTLFVLASLAAAAFATPAAPAASPAAAAADGTILACVDANFSGACLSLPVTSNQCINFSGALARFNKQISAFGPDTNVVCTLFAALNCVGSAGPFITNPGIDDLRTVGFNDATSSFLCASA